MVNLNEAKVVVPERINYDPQTITQMVPAEKTLKIATSPDGEEFLEGTVPEGKVWKVVITISIEECDA